MTRRVITAVAYPSPKDSFEDLLEQAGLDNVLIDFRELGPDGAVRTMYPSTELAEDAQ